MRSLGWLLVESGRDGEAEQCFCIAAGTGDTFSMRSLGRFLADSERVGEAEQWFRTAADAGDTWS